MENSEGSPSRIKTWDILELFILSAASLYLELLIIRWMSTDFRAFTVFKTFPLITCFVGLGAGFAINRDAHYRLLPLAVLMMALDIKIFDFLGFGIWPLPALSVFQWNNLAGLMQMNTAYIVVFMLIVILLLAFPFGICFCLGARLGVLFGKMKPLTAYSINVAGAVAGSIIFPVLSAFGLPPWQLLLIPTALIVIDLFLKERKFRPALVAPFLLIPPMFLMLPDQDAKPLYEGLLEYKSGKAQTLWSPYQRIDVTVFSKSTDRKKADQSRPPGFIGLELSANRAFYQYYLDLKPDSPWSSTVLIDSIRKDYSLPFSFNASKDVLILGCGTGQNVSSALEAGAEHIDAVEIDPVILQVGKKYNPDLCSPKVNIICDDARHFTSNTDKRYDVINYSTVDSHTVCGLGSSVRIDTYLYTKESIAKSLSLLKDDGIMQISFVTFAPWMKERLFASFTEAAGYSPIALEGRNVGTIFLLGRSVKDGTIKIPSYYKRLDLKPGKDVRVLTDDWPYLYVRTDIVDAPYLLLVAEVLLLSAFAGRRFLFAKPHASSWQMFFLGAAFLLLELHAISFLALLYGSTWITSAVVINCVLVLILLANAFVDKFTQQIRQRQAFVYLALLASILSSYFLPTDALLASASNSQFLIYSFMTIVTILPMGIAALIFATAFAGSPNVTQAIAFNLFGAVIGGLLEYLSNYWGIRSLDLVAAALYGASFLAYTRAARSAPPPSPSQ